MYKNSNGNEIKLGIEIGKGGEASVYSIEGNNNLVAKIYNDHHSISSQKLEKLQKQYSDNDHIEWNSIGKVSTIGSFKDSQLGILCKTRCRRPTNLLDHMGSAQIKSYPSIGSFLGTKISPCQSIKGILRIICRTRSSRGYNRTRQLFICQHH